MQGNQASSIPSTAGDAHEPKVEKDSFGSSRRLREGGDDGEREIGVAHRVNPLPLREEEEEELSEADIMEEHDMRDLDDDDLAKADGPDA